MKVKYLLTALALPAMFAACSQDDIVTDVQNQPIELLGKVAGDVDFTIAPMSRMVWGATDSVKWEAEDGFSLFWAGNNLTTDAEVILNGKVNALYAKNGDVFTSQNIVYVGNHVIVYPADYTHLGDGAIVATAGKVGEDGELLQDGNIAFGKRSVWTTDSLLTIAAPLTAEQVAAGVKEEAGKIYAGGYGEAVPAKLQALSSNLVLNMDFRMGNTTSVNVKKVILRAKTATVTEEETEYNSASVFTTKGNLYAKAIETGKYNRDIIFKPASEDGTTSEIVLTMPETEVVTTSDTTCTAQIALLPVGTIPANTTYEIEVVTNYGNVKINDAKLVTAKSGAVYCYKDYAEVKNAFTGGANTLDLTQELNLISSSNDKIAYRLSTTDASDDTKKTKTTAYGKRITLNVKVDMKQASITDMEVANSAELIAAYNTYDLLDKEGAESFKLVSKKPFELTPEAVAKILGNTNITLTQDLTGGAGKDTIKLVGAHTAIPNFTVKVNDTPKTLMNTASTVLVLDTLGTWALDVDAATAANSWSKIVNAGTLTISESNPKSGAVALIKGIENQDSIIISGSVALPNITIEQTAGAVSVPTGANFTVGQGNVNIFAGKVYVDGYMGVTGGNVYNAGTVEAAGIINTTSGAFKNVGTIKVMNGTAIVVISHNEATPLARVAAATPVVGSIESYARNSSVNVTSDGAEGYIKWVCDATEYTAANDDTFNYAILNGNLTVKSQGDLLYIEVAEGKTVTLSETLVVDAEAGTTDELNLEEIIINKNATLVIPTGSTVSAKLTKKTGANEPIILGSFTDETSTAPSTPEVGEEE